MKRDLEILMGMQGLNKIVAVIACMELTGLSAKCLDGIYDGSVVLVQNSQSC